MPNPAIDQATLLLTTPLAEVGVLSIVNALGEVVQQVRIPIGIQRVDFGTSQLSPGVYHVAARTPSTQLGVGRLSIMR